jgi:hypothetical protein
MNEQRNELTTEDIAGSTPSTDTTDDVDAGDEQERMDTAATRQEAESGDEGSPSADADDERSMPLFSAEEGERFRNRWSDIQTGFVDRPREMVEEADHLVADLMQRLAAQFTEERGRLEAHWESNDDVSTEELRVTLTRYRSFFERLLAV